MKPAPKPVKRKKSLRRKHQFVYGRYACGCYFGPVPKIERVTACPDHQHPVSVEWGMGLKRLTEHAALVRLNDDFASKIVRWRDGYQCVLCTSREQPQNGHVIVRGKWGTRWNLKNQNCQCSSCNIRHGKAQQAHYYINWFRREWGDAEWDKLSDEAETRGNDKDWTIPELRALLEKHESLADGMLAIAVHDKQTLERLGYYG